jgi:hypothetical protein
MILNNRIWAELNRACILNLTPQQERMVIFRFNNLITSKLRVKQMQIQQGKTHQFLQNTQENSHKEISLENQMAIM